VQAGTGSQFDNALIGSDGGTRRRLADLSPSWRMVARPESHFQSGFAESAELTPGGYDAWIVFGVAMTLPRIPPFLAARSVTPGGDPRWTQTRPGGSSSCSCPCYKPLDALSTLVPPMLPARQALPLETVSLLGGPSPQHSQSPGSTGRLLHGIVGFAATRLTLVSRR